MIKVNEDWRIDVDANSFTLLRRSVGKDSEAANFGQEVWVRHGYYITPGGALFAIARSEMVSHDTLVAMKEIITMYRELADRFDQPSIRAMCDRAIADFSAVKAKPASATAPVSENPKKRVRRPS